MRRSPVAAIRWQASAARHRLPASAQPPPQPAPPRPGAQPEPTPRTRPEDARPTKPDRVAGANQGATSREAGHQHHAGDTQAEYVKPESRRPANSTARRRQEERRAAEARRRAADLIGGDSAQHAERCLSGTKIEAYAPGGGGDAYASYDRLVQSVYQQRLDRRPRTRP